MCLTPRWGPFTLHSFGARPPTKRRCFNNKRKKPLWAFGKHFYLLWLISLSFFFWFPLLMLLSNPFLANVHYDQKLRHNSKKNLFVLGLGLLDLNHKIHSLPFAWQLEPYLQSSLLGRELPPCLYRSILGAGTGRLVNVSCGKKRPFGPRFQAHCLKTVKSLHLFFGIDHPWA